MSSKIGGALPFLIPLFTGLSTTGAVAGGAASVAKVVNETRAAKEKLSESKRHNNTMEAIVLGKCLYLQAFRKELALYFKPYPGYGFKKKKINLNLPDMPLTNISPLKFAHSLIIPYFHEVYTENDLPSDSPHYREPVVVNLDDAMGS